MLKTRKEAMERQRAIDTARNVLSSRTGLVVMGENKFPERTLQLLIRRIEGEAKKQQTRIENDKKLFKKDRLIYNFEPTIVVERQPPPLQPLLPPSGDGGGGDGSGYPADEPPGYMRPRRNARGAGTPSNLPSIDAFTVRAKKKVNLWEGRTHDESYVTFRSILMSSPPLSHLEKMDLEKGWKIHRPASRLEELMRQRLDNKLEEKRTMLRSLRPQRPESTRTVFITQQLEATGDYLDVAEDRGIAQPDEEEADRPEPAAANTEEGEASKKIIVTFDQRKLETFEAIRKRQKLKYQQSF